MQVNFHRAFLDSKLFCNSFIREPLRNEASDFDFPFGQCSVTNAVSRPSVCLVKHDRFPLWNLDYAPLCSASPIECSVTFRQSCFNGDFY